MLDFEMEDIANKDFLWAFASIAFVWLYMSFHLKSLFLSSMSMLSIVLSFPMTLVISRLIF